MTIETIVPENEATWLNLRKQDITSTESAALFGLSPYMTEFELWHRKHDNLDVEFKVNDRMLWGTRLQDSIAAGVAEDQRWTIRRMMEYMRDTELKAGASFDFAQWNCPNPMPAGIYTKFEGQKPEDISILEIKNVDSLTFKEGWIVEGDDVQAPPHIEIQIQQQLMLSGMKIAYIGALIGGNRVVLIRREPDQVVIEQIRKKIVGFWDSIAHHAEPKPDFARDADFISRLHAYSEPGKVFNADEQVSKLAFAYKQAADEIKSAEKKKDAAKAEILTIVGEAEKIIGPWGSISAGMVGPAHVEYEREGYRTFKPYWKKEIPHV